MMVGETAGSFEHVILQAGMIYRGLRGAEPPFLIIDLLGGPAPQKFLH